MTHAMTCRLAVPVALAAALASSGAAATELDLAGNVHVSFDQASFSASTTLLGALDPATFTVTTTATGVELGFNGQMSAATDSLLFGSLSESGSFSASIGFTALPGFQITGYTLTYEGVYDIEPPGFIEAGGIGGSFFAATGAGLNTPFSQVGTVAGAVAPTLTGGVSAQSDVQIVQVQVGVEIVQTGTTFEQQCSDPADPNTCILVEVPVFEERPVYMDQPDYGTAFVSLRSVKIEANVAAVPEPQTYALMLGGLAMLAGLARRRRG